MTPQALSVDRETSAEIGVVIPVYNGARWLASAVQSLREQTSTDWIGVVVDDGSTDGSAELAAFLLADDPRFRLLRQHNHGVAAARRSGVDQLPASVRYLAFLDVDDRYEPLALATLRDALHRRPDAVGAFCLARYIDEAGDSILPGRHEAVQQDRRVLAGRRVVSGEPADDVGFASLAVSSAIWPAAVVLLRRDEVRAVGGPDPSFVVQEDWELYLRLSRRGPFVPIPHTLVDYRRHDANATASTPNHDFQQDRMWHKAWRASENTPTQRRTISRSWRWLQLRQVREQAKQFTEAIRRREPAVAVQIVIAMILCSASIALPGPPPAHPTLSRLMKAIPYSRHSWEP